MDAISTTSFDSSLLSAGVSASTSPLEMLQLISTMLGINVWIIITVLLGLTVFFCIVFWKLFVKAHHKGYEALVSGHNGYVFITMAGKQGRYYFLFIVPIIIMNAPVFLGMINATAIQACSLIGMFLFLGLYVDVTFSLMKKFKKGLGFTIGTVLLPCIFYPILALGKSKYTK